MRVAYPPNMGARAAPRPDRAADHEDAVVIADGARHSHAYPSDLAELVLSNWNRVGVGTEVVGRPREGFDAAPPFAELRRLLSICYQASLLHDEGRPTFFRVALGAPNSFASDAGPPKGLHRLLFTEPRTFDEQQLRRLAPAVKFQNALIGVNQNLEIWGLIHSGPGWLRFVSGGRGVRQFIPLVPIVAVTGPGRIQVAKGPFTIAQLGGGVLAGPSLDVFESGWVRALFGCNRSRLETAVLQHVLRRVIATIRGARHGGTIVILPNAALAETARRERTLTLKYAFRDEEPRRRLSTLVLAMEPLLERRGLPSIAWNDYEASLDPRIVALDESVFEIAHLLASLAEVDGAVVVTAALELLGFGGEISAALPDASAIAHAIDLDGAELVPERADHAGMRHRSVYRLCQAMHECVAIVVSQDGGVRFIRWHERAVTYWDQIATGPWEL